MKVIIEGRRYDTEAPKTKLIAKDSSIEGPSDFRYWEEALYRTGNGNWFLAGEGGAMTHWSQSAGGSSRCGGSGIRPLSSEQAREWLERAEKTAELEEHFGDEIEDA